MFCQGVPHVHGNAPSKAIHPAPDFCTNPRASSKAALRDHVLLLNEPDQSCMPVGELRATQQTGRTATELQESPLDLFLGRFAASGCAILNKEVLWHVPKVAVRSKVAPIDLYGLGIAIRSMSESL